MTLHGVRTAVASQSSAMVAPARSGTLASGRRTLILPHRGIILAVAWAPDSSHLITGALDGSARMWETHAADVDEVARLSAQDTSSGIDRARFSASGEQAFTVDENRTAVKIWKVGRHGEGEWANLPAAQFLGDVEFLPDGRLAASVADGAVTVWNEALTRRISTVGARDRRLAVVRRQSRRTVDCGWGRSPQWLGCRDRRSPLRRPGRRRCV